MRVEEASGKDGFRSFEKLGKAVYCGNPSYRGTEGSLERLLLLGPTAFHRHAAVKAFLVAEGNDDLARFALIRDERLPGYLQVAFFEAHPGIRGLSQLIRDTARKHFPGIPRLVVGLHGHLNYGAGFLLNRFDEPPVFGLPYTMDYYPSYFEGFTMLKMHSFRFPMDRYAEWAFSVGLTGRIPGLTLRFMNKKKIREEVPHYTWLNNQSFRDHVFWADRSPEEDVELFYPFRFLIRKENMVFAEQHGKPVGFFLWYPDFNQLVKGPREINALDVLQYRLNNPIDTFRFTEIGILPAYRRSDIGMAMIRKALPVVMDQGYRYCEGGFIFEENRASMALVNRMLARSFGRPPAPYRSYAVYEGIV